MDSWLAVCVVTIVAAPSLVVLTLGVLSWLGVRFSERWTASLVGAAFGLAAGAAVSSFVGMLLLERTSVRVALGSWFSVEHYSFEWSLLADRLSLPFAAFAAVLLGLIGAFSRRYLHREQGFFRFYLLLALFGAGVQVLVLAGGLDQAFFGWELVGLTSALLIAFFHERPKPVEHSLRAFLTYRVCDAGLLGALVWLHHRVGSAAFVEQGEVWATLRTAPEAFDTALIGFLLLWASMGKSAQAPLGGWLPRAMEGPTPSSAIFYGSISIHLGPYLLLRAADVLDAAPGVAIAVMVVGGLTALHGSFVGRVQTDIKSLLAYASMTQVGLILVEIGAGLRFVPLIHILGHAAIRSLEILRSPNLLHDHHHLERAVGRQIPRTPFHLERLAPERLRPWLYRFALERGYHDALLRKLVMGLGALVTRLDRAERAVTGWIAGAGFRDRSRP